jgi:hypothetical protein
MMANAYILLGDPAFLRPSVASYYRHVDRIVVSFDRDGRSWTGTDLPTEECLALIRAIDVDGKCDFRPGSFSGDGEEPLERETAQRRKALEEASDGADWVLQLDTDEVIPRAETILSCLDRADARGAGALEYPARWLYTRVRQGRFLESCSRAWTATSSYPGPLAVRAGTELHHARQTSAPVYRADVRAWNTDPARPKNAIVHEVVPLDAAVLHYSWVRSAADIARKVGWSGHAPTLRASGEYERWERATRHPLRTAASAPFARRGRRYRLTSAPDYLDEGV